MELGDRVKILPGDEYGGKFTGAAGTIQRTTSLRAGCVGVLIDNHENQSSRYGTYWFEKKHVQIIGNKQNTESEENTMLNGYDIASIQFMDGSNQSKRYLYALYDGTISVGDTVVVQTGHHGFALATIMEILPERDGTIEHERQVVARVDFSDYYARKAKEKRLVALKREMDVKVKELQANALYELLAEKDPALAAMLQEYKAIIGGAEAAEPKEVQ